MEETMEKCKREEKRIHCIKRLDSDISFEVRAGLKEGGSRGLGFRDSASDKYGHHVCMCVFAFNSHFPLGHQFVIPSVNTLPLKRCWMFFYFCFFVASELFYSRQMKVKIMHLNNQEVEST